MQVKDIYEKYKIPPNLAEHMLKVTKVALFICQHWRGQGIDVELVKKGALLHDLGNIVKFNFARSELWGLRVDHDYWRKVQKEFFNKYGTDAHKATIKILHELGINGRLLDEVLLGEWHEPGGSLERIIVLYADSRVGPFGVVSLEGRIKDLRKRYGAGFKEEAAAVALERERKVQENLTVPVSEITEESVARSDGELLNTEI